ncbi:hypothetical protein ACNKHV_10680 [Shigella flexneri]
MPFVACACAEKWSGRWHQHHWSSEACMLGGMAMKWRWRTSVWKLQANQRITKNLVCGPVQSAGINSPATGCGAA